MDKNIAVKASIDIGENITTLIQQLANQIGTTADKVFPWYVQQQIIEGYSYMIIIAALGLIFTITFIFSFRRADFDNGDKYVFTTVISGLVLFVLLLSCSKIPEFVSKIINPEYHAIKAIVIDMSMLVK